jgi:hypothetical protein
VQTAQDQIDWRNSSDAIFGVTAFVPDSVFIAPESNLVFGKVRYGIGPFGTSRWHLKVSPPDGEAMSFNLPHGRGMHLAILIASYMRFRLAQDMVLAPLLPILDDIISQLDIAQVLDIPQPEVVPEEALPEESSLPEEPILDDGGIVW